MGGALAIIPGILLREVDLLMTYGLLLQVLCLLKHFGADSAQVLHLSLRHFWFVVLIGAVDLGRLSGAGFGGRDSRRRCLCLRLGLPCLCLCSCWLSGLLSLLSY